MSLLLGWILKNPLLSGAIVVIIFLLSMCVVQYLEVQVLSSKLDAAEAKIESQDITLKSLHNRALAQKEEIEASRKKIAAITKKYNKATEELKNAQVPVDCGEAVNWGVGEVNSFIRGVQ